MQKKERKNATIAWLERSNPLRGLSIAQANNIFDAARNGDTQRLHWMFQEIETANPVLSMCVTRRSGAAANFRWRVAERAAHDETLAQEQRDALERFLGGIVNLADAFEHLDLALFRGFAHIQPIWEADGTVKEYDLVYDPANLMWSIKEGTITRVYDSYSFPNAKHPLGTDKNGMDMLTRLMYGGRVSLVIGFM